MLIFSAGRLFSLQNGQMCPQNSFSWFSWKILLFRRNCRIKKIFIIKRVITKKVIFVFGDRPSTTLLLRSEISLFWRTSCIKNFSSTFFLSIKDFTLITKIVNIFRFVTPQLNLFLTARVISVVFCSHGFSQRRLVRSSLLLSTASRNIYKKANNIRGTNWGH